MTFLTISPEISIMDIITLVLIAFLGVLWFINYKMFKPAAVRITDGVNGSFAKRATVKRASLHDAVIMQILCKIQMELQATKVILVRFHNGGNFANGCEMKKFTITHETPGGSKEPMMDKWVGILNSRFASVMLQLTTCDYFCVASARDCDDIDRAFKKALEFYEFESGNLFMIRQFDDSDEGFIGVFFKYPHVMGAEERDKVTIKIERLLNLINLKEASLKDDQ